MHSIYLTPTADYVITPFKSIADQQSPTDAKFIAYLDPAKWMMEFLNRPGAREQMLKDLRPRRTPNQK